MKRLRHIVWNGLAAMSTLLLIAAMALWVRSFWRSDVVVFFVRGADKPGSYFQTAIISNALGSFVLQRESGVVHYRASRRSIPSWPSTYPAGRVSLMHVELRNITVRKDTFWRRIGFSYYPPTNPSAQVSRHYLAGGRVPHWAVAIGFAIIPALWLWSFHRIARYRVGHCRACGYDLRATPARCPECGTLTATNTRP